MSNKTQRIHLAFLLTTVALALAVITLRIFALLGHFDAASGYFTSSTLSVAFTAVLVAAVIFGTVFSHELSELFVFSSDQRDIPTLFASAFSAAAPAAIDVGVNQPPPFARSSTMPSPAIWTDR